jgi:cobalt transporter subunit CbtB
MCRGTCDSLSSCPARDNLRAEADDRGHSNHRTLQPASAARASAVADGLASLMLLLGGFFLHGVGCAGPQMIHDTAHDSRHSLPFLATKQATPRARRVSGIASQSTRRSNIHRATGQDRAAGQDSDLPPERCCQTNVNLSLKSPATLSSCRQLTPLGQRGRAVLAKPVWSDISRRD